MPVFTTLSEEVLNIKFLKLWYLSLPWSTNCGSNNSMSLMCTYSPCPITFDRVLIITRLTNCWLVDILSTQDILEAFRIWKFNLFYTILNQQLSQSSAPSYIFFIFFRPSSTYFMMLSSIMLCLSLRYPILLHELIIPRYHSTYLHYILLIALYSYWYSA